MKISKFLPIIGIAIFVYILSKLDLLAVWNTMIGMDVRYLLLALAVVVFDVVVKSYKWRELIKPYGVNYPMKDCMKAWMVGFFASLITPGRVGDIVRAFALKQDEDISLGKAVTTVVLDRIIDMIVLFSLAIFGVIMLAQVYVLNGNILWTVVFAFIFFIAIVVLLMEEKYMKIVLKPVFHIMVKKDHGKGFRASFEEFYKGVQILKKDWETLLWVISLTLFIWIVSFLIFYFLGRAIGLGLSYPFLVLIMPSVLLIEALPISFSGLGTRDATLILFLSLASISASSAVSFSLMLLLGNYIIALVGLFFWIKRPVKLF